MLSPDAYLNTFTEERVKVVGKCYVDVFYNGQLRQDLPLYVVEGNRPALFGRNWVAHLGLDSKDLNKLCKINKVIINRPKDLTDMLKEYDVLFREELGTVKGVVAKLKVKEKFKAKFFKPRPVPFALKTGIEEEIHRLVNLGVIEKIEYSDWAAPMVPVRKPNGKIRICGDYKVTINQYLDNPQHPMPRPDELFSKLNGGEKFTKLDLSQAYQQVVVDEESRIFLTINTHLGLYHYKRLPFGISAAPAIFQSVMDKVLQGLEVGCFLDDLIVTGKDDEEHLSNLKKVLQRLSEFGFRLQQSKCQFMLPSVTYLGVKVDCQGLHMEEEATRAIREAPQPENKAELQSILGLANHYRKHVPNMSTLCEPLNRLLSNHVKWEWNDKCKKSFKKLKEILTKENVLIHYDPNKELLLAVDASPVGLGAVISHRVDSKEYPIAYASRTLTAAEKNYSQIEREGLAIVFGLKKFHQYIYGRNFTLITDNKPLSLILGPKKGIPAMAATRIQGWAMQLAAYDCIMECRTSHQNSNADALSRLPLPEDTIVDGKINWVQDSTELLRNQINQLPVTAKAISKVTQHDPILSRVKKFTTDCWPSAEEVEPKLLPFFRRRNEITTEEGCLLWGVRTIVPKKFQNQILEDLHENHPGIVKMKALARQHVWWPELDEMIQMKVQRCQNCQDMLPKAKAAQDNPWKWPSKPWQRLHVDFAGPFMGEHFFILVDAHSKWPEVHRMNTVTASETVKVMRNIFATHGVPEEVVSDNGGQFVSEEFQLFLKNNNVRSIRSAPYHPSSNGEAERFVRTFKEAMKTERKKKSWEHKIASFLLFYRSTPHSTTNRTPSELLMGRKIKTRLDAVTPNLGNKIKRKSAGGGINREIEVGEPVMARDYRQQKKSWINAVVIKKLGPVTYLVQVGDLIWKRHIDQLRVIDGHLLEHDDKFQDYMELDCPQLVADSLQFPELDEDQLEKDRAQTASLEDVKGNDKQEISFPGPSGVASPEIVSERGSNEISLTPVRRSGRNRVRPRHLEDYV